MPYPYIDRQGSITAVVPRAVVDWRDVLRQEPVSRFLTTDGTDDATKGTGKVNGQVTPVDLFAGPDPSTGIAGWEIDQIIVTLAGPTIFSQNFAGLAVLTNGVRFRVFRGAAVREELDGGRAVKDPSGFWISGFTERAYYVATAFNVLQVAMVFSVPLFLDATQADQIRTTVQDNLTSLSGGLFTKIEGRVVPRSAE